MKPTGNRVAIQPLKKEQEGLIVQLVDHDSVRKAVVMGIGKDANVPELKVGDRVLYHHHRNIGGRSRGGLLFPQSQEILAIIND